MNRISLADAKLGALPDNDKLEHMTDLARRLEFVLTDLQQEMNRAATKYKRRGSCLENKAAAAAYREVVNRIEDALTNIEAHVNGRH